MNYKVTIVFNDGSRTSEKVEMPNTYDLMRALDKCEIKSFKIELA